MWTWGNRSIEDTVEIILKSGSSIAKRGGKANFSLVQVDRIKISMKIEEGLLEAVRIAENKALGVDSISLMAFQAIVKEASRACPSTF